jgi:hypothetical protein
MLPLVSGKYRTQTDLRVYEVMQCVNMERFYEHF